MSEGKGIAQKGGGSMAGGNGQDAANPFVFVVGPPRSSTTLLQRMLDAHPNLAVIDETRWIAEWFENRTGVDARGMATQALLPRLLQHPRFPWLGVSREEMEGLIPPRSSLPYARFVGALFDLVGRSRGKPLVGDKTPRYVTQIPTLHALFPAARFIHLIRDGRGVALAVRDWTGKKVAGPRRFASWYRDPFCTTAVWWEWQVRLGLEDGRALGPALYREATYEALVRHTTDELASLCWFLGIPVDDAMLHFHEGRARTDPGLSAKKAWLAPTPGLRDWRTQMPPEDVERFEAAAGDLLEELGYERGCPKPSPRAIGHASGVRESFTEELRSLGRRLPGGWQSG